MALSTKHKIIIWVTVALIVVFLGLKTEITKSSWVESSLLFYGFHIGDVSGIGSLVYLGQYKYSLAIGAFLIGLALLMTVRKK